MSQAAEPGGAMKSGKHSAFNDLIYIFERHIERSVEAAREFHWLLVAVDGDTAASERRIHELRRAADAITDLALTAMERHHGPSSLQDESLVLIRHLGALLEWIECAAERMKTTSAPPPRVFEMAKTLVRATEEIQALLSSLHDPKRINERSFGCAKVRGLTHETHPAGEAERRELPPQHELVLTSMMHALSECDAIATLVEKEALSRRSRPPPHAHL